MSGHSHFFVGDEGARRIIDANARLVLSVQHTGTWFVMDLLNRSPSKPGFCLQHQNVGRTSGVPHGPLKPGCVVQLHATDWSADVARACIAAGIPVVVPLRHPHRSLLSRHHRAPGKSADMIVRGFKAIARLEGGRRFVVDGDLDVDQRRHEIKGLYAHMRLELPPDDEIARLAEAWRPVNHVPGPAANVRQLYPHDCEQLDEDVFVQAMLRSFGYRSEP